MVTNSKSLTSLISSHYYSTAHSYKLFLLHTPQSPIYIYIPQYCQCDLFVFWYQQFKSDVFLSQTLMLQLKRNVIYEGVPKIWLPELKMKYVITFITGHYCPFKSCHFLIYAMVPVFQLLIGSNTSHHQVLLHYLTGTG